jgi:hypothetical protein
LDQEKIGGTLMLESNNTRERSLKARILYAWEDDEEKEKLLRDLGGIESGHRNEARIQQIEQTIESLKQTLQDDK